MAEAFIAQVFRLHVLPDTIVWDRGTTCMSQFWTSVLRQLCANPTPSTAFHPQKDGQVERVNAALEDYLRHYVSLKQDDGASWLPMAEFSYNNTPPCLQNIHLSSLFTDIPLALILSLLHLLSHQLINLCPISKTYRNSSLKI